VPPTVLDGLFLLLVLVFLPSAAAPRRFGAARLAVFALPLLFLIAALLLIAAISFVFSHVASSVVARVE
jgi:hypothetical protein